MQMRVQKRSKVHGFTLVELIIGMLLTSLVGMAAYTVFISSSRSSMVQENVTEAQQMVRASMNLLARDVRSAGFGLPDPPFSISIGGETHRAPVAITNSSSGPDTITLLGGGDERFWLDADGDCSNTDSDSTNDCNLPDKENPDLSHAQGSMTLKIKAENGDALDDFFDASSFDTNRAFISLGGIYYTTISGISRSGAEATLTLTKPLNRPYLDGTPVFIVKAIRYSLNTSLTGCSSANPCLARQDLAENNEVLAYNIEDIQFAFNLKGSSTFTNNASSSDIDITAVRANILSRTDDPEIGASSVSARPALEDRAAGATDAYRRRLLTSIIKVRNPRTGS